jgi:hypothetical protein
MIAPVRKLTLFLGLAVCVLPSSANATPANKQAFSRYFGKYLPNGLDTCAVCHVRADANGAESLDEFPHNSFGDRLRVAREVLEKKNRDTGIRDRLIFIAHEDADDDNATNLQELLLGYRPGDSRNKPSPNEVENLPALLLRFLSFSNGYQWTPFKQVKRPHVPRDSGLNSTWPINEIDHFIAAEHRARGLTPQTPAEPEILLRRIYLDLTGLSPSPADIRRFIKESSSNRNAYEEVVDKLLDDPAYGERWGRHWMDVWRYSDWAGYKAALRDSQRHIWHWRDWIIESLNRDKPYDRMLVEMLAADELVPEDADAIRATGFLARNYFRDRDAWMDNVVKHTSQGFLGLTVGCAKCHDHMYDPISQRDYYSMRAIFERYNVRTDRIPGVLDVAKNGIPRAYDNSLTAETWLFESGDERRPLKDDAIPPGVPESLGGSFTIEPVSLPLFASKPDRRKFVKRDLIAQAKKAVADAKGELALQAADAKLAALITVLEIEVMEDGGKKDSEAWTAAAMKLVELQRQAVVSDVRWKLSAGNAAVAKAETVLENARKDKSKTNDAKAEKSLATAKKNVVAVEKLLTAAEKALTAEVTTKYVPRKQSTYPATSNGRRLAFARWLTARQNPLTARVAMNHIWLRHFGQPIVPTVNEFGGNGREPTHPALLDWLADEFMARNWSMKEIHRLIVTSASYRMSSLSNSSNVAADPDNHFLWRMPTRRMEGEIVRDNLLHISGRIDRTMGGPDIDNKLAQTSMRRSIYLRHAHEKLVEFVQIFDGPSVTECYMREDSVKPHQALALANSPLTVEGSSKLAKRLHEETDGLSEPFIEEAYMTILSRRPMPEEAALCRNFLGNGKPDSTTPATLPRCEKLINVLFNHNDFIAIR